MKRLVGVYTGSAEILQKEWKTVEYLKDEIGLNLIILGAGPAGDKWSPSPDVISKAPFKLPVSKEPDGLNKFLKQAHKRDLDVWICIALYAEMDSGPNYPELMFRDFEGRVVEPVSKYGMSWAWSWCPSNERVRSYNEALLYDLARKYDIDGFTLTHHRYSPIGHSIYNLFGCGCGECERAASKLGYDFGRMRDSMLKLLQKLKQIDAGKMSEIAELTPGFLDFFYHLGSDAEVLDWLNFRCDLIQSGMKRYYEAAKRAREELVVGSDNFPPTFSMISGHRYRDFEGNADFLSPLLSHIMIFTLFNFIELATRLKEWNKGLSDEKILGSLYRAFGYDSFDLPVNLSLLLEHPKLPSSDYSETRLPLGDIVRYEILKAKSFVSGTTPMYGIIAAHSQLNPTAVEKRAVAMKDAKVDGIILQLGPLPGPLENVAAIKRVLHSTG